MKNTIYMLAILICGTAFAQEKPTQIKEEVKTKTIKNTNGKEEKIKIITRETSDVKLNKADKNKVNQSRISAIKKVDKMVMVDNDEDAAYDFLTKETFYISGDNNYKFSPNKKGFNITYNDNNSDYVKVGNAFITSANGNYIVRGKVENGLGYFDNEGNFIVEYYDENSKGIKQKTYKKENEDMQ